MSPVRGVDPIRVARMRPPDATRLARTAGHLFDHPADRSALRSYLADRRNLFLLATMRGATAGFLRGTALGQIHTPRRQMFLYEIGVTRRYRRRGVGRALIEHFLSWCRARGFEEAFVFTDPGNRAAVRLYRGTGAVTETPRDRMFVYRLRKRDRRAPRAA